MQGQGRRTGRKGVIKCANRRVQVSARGETLAWVVGEGAWDVASKGEGLIRTTHTTIRTQHRKEGHMHTT